MAKRKLVNDMKYHYTYRITNIKEGMYYYGVHSCDCLPKEDIGVQYWSSSKRNDFVDHQKQNPEQYKYKVIKIFGTRIEAVEHEMFLHYKFDVKLHQKFYNDSNQTSTGFDTTGKKFPTNNYRLGKTMMFLEKVQKFIPDEIVAEYTSLGWVIGYLPKTKEHCANISKSKIGQPPPNKGIPCSDEQKKKISKTKTGVKMSKEARKNISDGHKGLPGTNTNKIKINNGTIEKFVDNDSIDVFISTGWYIGVVNPSSRASVTGKILINNGIINKYIVREEFNDYIIKGWNKGSFRSKKI